MGEEKKTKIDNKTLVPISFVITILAIAGFFINLKADFKNGMEDINEAKAQSRENSIKIQDIPVMKEQYKTLDGKVEEIRKDVKTLLLRK